MHPTGAYILLFPVLYGDDGDEWTWSRGQAPLNARGPRTSPPTPSWTCGSSRPASPPYETATSAPGSPRTATGCRRRSRRLQRDGRPAFPVHLRGARVTREVGTAGRRARLRHHAGEPQRAHRPHPAPARPGRRRGDHERPGRAGAGARTESAQWPRSARSRRGPTRPGSVIARRGGPFKRPSTTPSPHLARRRGAAGAVAHQRRGTLPHPRLHPCATPANMRRRGMPAEVGYTTSTSRASRNRSPACRSRTARCRRAGSVTNGQLS